MRTLRALLTNWRYYVLLVLAGVSMVGILGEPTSEQHFIAYLIAGKVIGIVAAGCGLHYAIEWSINGKLDLNIDGDDE